MSDLTLLSRIQGSLLGVRLGDALGLPWEAMSRRKILEKTHGKGIVDFVDPAQRAIVDYREAGLYATSDDWQLTEAVARSIIRMKDFHLRDQALEHVSAFRASRAGWGKTTKDAVRELELFFTEMNSTSRSPETPVKYVSGGKGCGNGVAMKIAPLALFLGARENGSPLALKTWTKMLGELTHGDPLAWITAYALALVIQGVMRQEPQTGEKLLAPVIERIEILERQYLSTRFGTHAFSRKLAALADARLGTATVDEIQVVTGDGFHAAESVAFAIAIGISREPVQGLRDAVNGGGDTDTNAAMAGAILGARYGAIWDRWSSYPKHFNDTLEIGQRLHEATTSSNL